MTVEEQFDGMLLGMAQQLTAQRGGGVQDLLEMFFSFLRRKTDFYSGMGSEKGEKMVMDIFKKHEELSQAAKAKVQAEQAKKVFPQKKTFYCLSNVVINFNPKF